MFVIREGRIRKLILRALYIFRFVFLLCFGNTSFKGTGPNLFFDSFDKLVSKYAKLAEQKFNFYAATKWH